MKKIIQELRFTIFNSIIENDYLILQSKDIFTKIEIDGIKLTLITDEKNFIDNFDVYFGDFSFNNVVKELYETFVNEQERIKSAEIIKEIIKKTTKN